VHTLILSSLISQYQRASLSTNILHVPDVKYSSLSLWKSCAES
jgi:hypothetical protein